jgi:hypothetical protein
VSVADVFARLIVLGVLTQDNAFFSCLKSLNDQWTFELHQNISPELNDPRITVHIRDQTSTKMTIFAVDLYRKMWTILVSPNDSIELVKGKLLLVNGIPMDQQRLIYDRKELEDGQTLSDYSIQNESKIHLVTRWKGGKPIIRLSSINSHMISNVTVRLDLSSKI